MEYRICRGCKIHHYENCRTCFGFGVYDNGKDTPVSAANAHDKDFLCDVVSCPECKSTAKGMPILAIERL